MSYAKIFQEALKTVSEVAGIDVKYSRGSDFTYLRAVPSAGQQNANEGDVVVEYRSRDFIIDVCDLVVNEVPITPKAGDTITEEVGTKVHTYQVGRPEGGNDQPWRFCDTGRTTIRVHSLLKGITNR